VVSTTGLGKKRLTLIEFRTEEAELANFRSHPIFHCQDQTMQCHRIWMFVDQTFQHCRARMGNPGGGVEAS
jgi:hypothetical protein